MRKYYVFIALSMSFLLTLASCDKDDEKKDSATLVLELSGLKDLGDDYAYEGWIMVDGDPVSTGTFTVDESGGMSKTMFEMDPGKLDQATGFILTIEPKPDSDPNPSRVHLMAGNFSGSNADLSIKHGNAIGTDLANASGKYILATPTDGSSDTNENSGVWWLNPDNGPGRGLELPELVEGWTYEGWAIIDDIPVSTGKFTSVVAADKSDKYSSTTAKGPNFPGEDFLMNAPAGLSFPVNLAGRTVAITVEPDPDNSPDPFFLKPLTGKVPDPAEDHILYDMTNTAESTIPSGSAKR